MDYINLSALDEELNNPIDLQFSTCFSCNGYYESCFGEPLCATCHDFMYSEDFVRHSSRLFSSSCAEKGDDDSGNDEPSEEAGPSNRNRENGEIVIALPIPVVPEQDEPMGFAAEDEEEEEEERLSPEPGLELAAQLNTRRWTFQNKVASRLAMLVTPRPVYDQVVLTEDMSLKIPTEIWATIFQKLDDISLFMASKVSSKWKDIVLDHYPNSRWEEFVRKRWPLFNPSYAAIDWYSVYSDFLPCKLCFMNLNLIRPPDYEFSSGQMRPLRTVRLHKELKWLRLDHPEGILATSIDALNYNWLARIIGPPSSCYQGGVFYLNLKVPPDYPLKPPVVRFLTKIIHPNVSRHGDIGIDCIQHNWTLALTIPQVLLSVQSLLTDPYLESSMEPSIASLYENDRPTFDKIARIWTWKYAMHDVIVH